MAGKMNKNHGRKTNNSKERKKKRYKKGGRGWERDKALVLLHYHQNHSAHLKFQVEGELFVIL